MAVNKVLYGGNTLIDLTSDTVTAADVAEGVTFHLPDGTQATGTKTAPVLDEIFPPKCVLVARAKLRLSSTGIVTMSLNSAYAFTSGALKKSTYVVVFRADGNQFGLTVQPNISNDTPGSATSRGAQPTNSSTNPRLDGLSTSVLGEIAKFSLRQNTDFIATVYYSDADIYTNGQKPTKIPFQTLVSCAVSAGTLTITDM